MPIGPGTRLGPYEVTALIGEGGMGKVWRAHHTALKRDDALKVLPDAFASDPERLARFRREAQVLASLNHPNIAHVYGLEQSDGVQALVMELVEGPTLADRIAQGPIPVDEALPIAKQIAEALEAAHEQGIVHRDLKPANIKLRPDGTVKVLDFGLAKALEPASGRHIDATASPTITSPAMMTGVGMLLGTASYMSPEQARGKPVDKRSDIWAFGCVLYEMLTRARAFDGEDVSVVMASVIKSDPEWKVLPVDTPPSVRTVLGGCLQKDPRHRIRDIGDVRLALEGTFLSWPDPHTIPSSVTSSRSHRLLPTVAGIVSSSIITALVVWAAVVGIGDQPPEHETRFAITVPDGEEFPPNTGTLVAISPDGRTLIYRARREGVFRLYRRSLDQFDATPIGDPNAGAYVFFSPDSQWIGYPEGNMLKKVRVSGGSSQTVCELPAAIRSGSWSADDTIIVGATSAGLLRVSSAGGTPETIAKAETGQGHWYPHVLPGGQAVLFTSSSQQSPDAGELEILRLDTGERRKLLPGVAGRYVPTGHIVFVRGGTLWAVGFDLDRLALVGTPVPIVEGVRTEGGGAVQFAISDEGSLVYLPGGISSAERRLVWVGRDGRAELMNAPPRNYTNPRISPTGSHIALDVRDQEDDIWTWDIGRNTLTRFTFGPSSDTYPAWTADGRRLIFASTREKNLLAPFWQASDGAGAIERLATDPRNVDQPSISPDGKRLILRAISPETREDIVLATLDEGERKLEPMLSTSFLERNAELSPDGRWIAYQSNESGVFEIYVRPFPQVNDGRWQISTGGGTHPLWAPNGREIFYVATDQVIGGRSELMGVPVQGDTAFKAGNAMRLMDVSEYNHDFPGRSYDVSRDGRRFVMIRTETESRDTRVNVVLNWHEELKRLVPTR